MCWTKKKTTPAEVTAVTTMSANGLTNSVEADRSAYYDLNGEMQCKIIREGYNFTCLIQKKKLYWEKTPTTTIFIAK
jgi:hypothetical protein